MTLWKANRNPDKYPAAWHSALRAQPGLFMLGMSWDVKELELLQRKFNAFKATLRTHGPHPTAQALAKRKCRMTIEVTEGGNGLYCLWLKTRWGHDTIDQLTKGLTP